MLNLSIGTVETLLVDVSDKLGNLDDLTGANPRYDVFDKDGTPKIADAVVAVQAPDLLTARCVVNTAGWAPGHYYLWIRFQASPDSPRLGPLEFKVNP